MKTTRIRRPIAFGALAFLATISLVACAAGGSTDTPADGNSLTSIKIGSIPVTDAAVVVLGDQHGFFKDEGLKVEFGNPAAGGSSVVAAVIAGEYQVGYSATLSVFQAVAGGNDLTMIAPASGSFDDPAKGTNDLITSPKLGLKSAKDLEGKQVAVNAAGGFAEMLGKNSVLEAGGDPGKVQWVQLGFPDQLPALQSGRIQGFVAGEPFGTLARDEGEVTLTNTLYDVSHDEWLLGTWFASRAATEKNPQLFEKIQAAITTSLKYSVAHEDELRKIIPDFAGIDPKIAGSIRLSNYATPLTVQTLEPMADAAVRTGLLEKKPDLEALIWKP
ncbi:ABC transporter substrate-binding protein [Microbacterium kribbense]|uniref:ABC transporter substrate-binding protein n=1 Tax=Microbacterium kribbense TaxID=433645 RepID=A0ABP7GGU1_9MICO